MTNEDDRQVRTGDVFELRIPVIGALIMRIKVLNWWRNNHTDERQLVTFTVEDGDGVRDYTDHTSALVQVLNSSPFERVDEE